MNIPDYSFHFLLLLDIFCFVQKDILDTYLTPSNARIDLMSATFGRASDYSDSNNDDTADTEQNTTIHSGDALMFSPEDTGSPFTEPEFGTKYWCHVIPSDVIENWVEAASPSLPSDELGLHLPAVNPFVPTEFGLKSLSIEESKHPLLGCSLELFSGDEEKEVSL